MDVLGKVWDFYRRFEGEKGYIGFSLMGEAIPYFCVAKSKFPVIIVSCAVHAREYVTAYLALRLAERFDKTGKAGTVYFLPAVNPDGIRIALDGNGLYKANARGVDLNVNFDARWGQGAENVRIKGDKNYIGEYPFSEPESRALRDFTLFVRPDMTISYHSKGEEIYYEFHQTGERLLRDRAIAEAVARVTGYKIKSTPFSCGGYKDWCVEKLAIPAITIEAGSEKLSHPIGEEFVGEIFSRNAEVIPAAIKKLTECKWI